MSLDFLYPLPWRAHGAHPGSHASVHRGGVDEFSGLDRLLANPQPRHIDIRASLKDPLEHWWVRSFRQRTSISVEVIADLSASMGAGFGADKRETLRSLVEMVAWSAYRQGDLFGFHAASGRLIEALSLPRRFYKGGVPEFCTKLRYHQPEGSGINGLIEACGRLGRTRSLVFLVSDFHFPNEEIGRMLMHLARHDVVPVVLWDPAECEALPDYGLMVLSDPETGEKRRLWMRPGLREAFKQGFSKRRLELERLLGQRGRAPLFLNAHFVADDLTRYFLMGASSPHSTQRGIRASN